VRFISTCIVDSDVQINVGAVGGFHFNESVAVSSGRSIQVSDK
jgi:hypothetical protein